MTPPTQTRDTQPTEAERRRRAILESERRRTQGLEQSRKVAQTAGKGIKTTGKGLDRAGQNVRAAGGNIERAGGHIKQAGEQAKRLSALQQGKKQVYPSAPMRDIPNFAKTFNATVNKPLPFRTENQPQREDAEENDSGEEEPDTPQETEPQNIQSTLQQARVAEQMTVNMDAFGGGTQNNEDAIRKKTQEAADKAANAVGEATFGIGTLIWLNMKMIYGKHIQKGKHPFIGPSDWGKMPLRFIDQNGTLVDVLIIMIDILVIAIILLLMLVVALMVYFIAHPCDAAKMFNIGGVITKVC